MMLQKFKPFPYEEFPKDWKYIDDTNCLAFALGLIDPHKKDMYLLERTDEPIKNIFLNCVKKLGFNPQNFNPINQEEEKRTEGYIIRIYGFEAVETNIGILYDFHVIRREPNGKWVHKPGFGCIPCEITPKDLEEISKRYGKEFVSFAIIEP